MVSFYSESTITNWVSSFESFGNKATEIASKLTDVPYQKEEIRYFKIGKASGESPVTNSTIKDNLYNYFVGIRRAKQVIPYNKYNSAANKCSEMSGTLHGILQKNNVQGKILVEDSLRSAIDKLLLNLGELPSASEKEILLTSNTGACRLNSQQEVVPLLNRDFDFKFFELRGIVDAYDGESLNNAFNTIVLTDTLTPPPDTGVTPINVEQEGSRKLIDTLAKGNATNEANSQINLSGYGEIAGYDLELLELCESIFSCCLGTISAVQEMAPQLLTVRFRNITLPVDQDDVFNLSTWLYAFQKQMMNTLYDMGEFLIDYLVTMNQNQIKIVEHQSEIVEKINSVTETVNIVRTCCDNLSTKIEQVVLRLDSQQVTLQNLTTGMVQTENDLARLESKVNSMNTNIIHLISLIHD